MSTFYCFQVVDGDTFDVSPNWLHRGVQGSRVRVANVNAPELHEHGGPAAKQRLISAVLGKYVVLYGQALSYGRLVADVTVDGTNLRTLL
ncbi:MAG: hypothetical protein F4089_01575 [Gammaproteobacteria bacterium]|nr:hypothetical protein [Gammaproteobacteria bacterium]MYJ73843.1 hypothetical protein [Gammaproteobacteria bacterium]